MASLQGSLQLAFVVAVWSVRGGCVQASIERCVEGDVRLVGGSHYREGTVEVCRHEQWGRVCDDFWDDQDSAVVCRQLGLSNQDVMAFTGDDNEFNDNRMLPYVLDDLGCNGSETHLLECLPNHNCVLERNENAGVRCQRKGVTLEYASKRLPNNSLITLNDLSGGNGALYCATDSRICCTAESDYDGSWYMPNGLVIAEQLDNLSEALYISRNNQTIGLNYVNISGYEVSSGIYHCEIADDSNVTNHLYVGIYPQDQGTVRVTSLKYDNAISTLTCTSAGGPATTVQWSKDSIGINNDQDYEQSVVIVNRTSATYESRLWILKKSSKATGNYTCTVSNSGGSSHANMYLEVCGDMELRFGDHYPKNVEVCSNDHWHVVSNGAIVNNITQGNIAVAVVAPTLVTIEFSSSDVRVRGYTVSCTTGTNGQIHSVIVTDVNRSREVTLIQISGLTPNTNYECCVQAYIETNIPINMVNMSCIKTGTSSLSVQPQETSEINNTLYMTGFWASLSICILLLCVCIGCIILLLIVLKRNSSKYATGSTEKMYTEHMVDNPLYSDTGSIHESYRDRNLSIAANPQYGTRAEVTHTTYETISEFPPRLKVRDKYPGTNEPNTNGLENNLYAASLQLTSDHSKSDTVTSQLYSTIAESHIQQELGSSEETPTETTTRHL